MGAEQSNQPQNHAHHRRPHSFSVDLDDSNNHGVRHRRRRSLTESDKNNTLVTINVPEMKPDPLSLKLENLPTFLPLLHEVENASKMFGGKQRALENVRSKLNPQPFVDIMRKYEAEMRRNSREINSRQEVITKSVKKIDTDVSNTFRTLSERQRKFAKHVDALSKVADVGHTLKKCQGIFQNCERVVQVLNGFLPMADRLEVWDDNFEDVEVGEEPSDCDDLR